ncbi:MAG: tol-pal system YbgF family protein [Pirellulaceae bacterium]
MNRTDVPPVDSNELADRIESGLAGIQSYLPIALGGIVVAAIAAVGWGVYSGQRTESQSRAWTEFYYNLSGSDADAFLDVAEGYPGTTMSGWAKQAAGDNYLFQGIQALYINRKEGLSNLQLAIETFEDVIADSPSQELERKATLGLAKANESLGELDQAREYYERYLSLDPPFELLSSVNQQLAFIGSPAGKSFYDWFSKLDPKPDAPITLPDNLSLPPASPDLEFTPTDEGGSLSDSTGTDDVQQIDVEGLEMPDLSTPEAKSNESIEGLDLPEQNESSTDAAAESSDAGKAEQSSEVSGDDS